MKRAATATAGASLMMMSRRFRARDAWVKTHGHWTREDEEASLAAWQPESPDDLEPIRISMGEMAALLPSSSGPADDAQFQGEVVRVAGATRRVDLNKNRWTVRNREGVAITKLFRTREQAEYLADQTGEFVVVEVPVLWVKGMPTIRAIPLYGVSIADQWFQVQIEPTEPSATAFTAGQKGVWNARSS